ncbi:MAG: tRNA pseudouridine(38-40) synthase TruA [Bacteroidia bacterium]|nr:tRNA pseudouridine(38-40) synthase TruA [Bacteroidia bacterium]
MRYFLDIAYQGARYHGWQIQENAHSIQAEIQHKLSLLLQEDVEITGSGRTDTGVHAEQQIAHLDCHQPLNHTHHRYKLNHMLPPDIAIANIYKVSPEAHARFDALARRYQYRISRRKNPFRAGLSYYDRRPYALERLNEAAAILLTYQDFEAFSKVHTQVNHFRCRIDEAYWTENDDLLCFHIEADRFLRGMVRAIVGTLLDIGQGKLNPNDLKNVIESKDRRQAGRTVPPEGLFLCQVKYPYPLEPADGLITNFEK